MSNKDKYVNRMYIMLQFNQAVPATPMSSYSVIHHPGHPEKILFNYDQVHQYHDMVAKAHDNPHHVMVISVDHLLSLWGFIILSTSNEEIYYE